MESKEAEKIYNKVVNYIKIHDKLLLNEEKFTETNIVKALIKVLNIKSKYSILDSYLMIKIDKRDKLILKSMAEKQRVSMSSLIRQKMLADVKE